MVEKYYRVTVICRETDRLYSHHQFGTFKYSMLSAGKVLFLAFFEICRLNKGPQDIPASRNLLTLCLVVIWFIVGSACGMLSQPIEKAVFAGVLEVALIIIFSLALLQIRGKSERWVQMVTALAGTGIIISILALPLYLFIGIGADEAMPPLAECMPWVCCSWPY